MRKKTLYLEFNGVPGCGKSTLCKALLNELSKYNFRYYDYQKLFSNFISKKTWRIHAIFMLLNPNGIRVLYNTNKALSKLKPSKNNRKFVPYLILTQLLIIYFGKKYPDSILVSDEGVIQYIISTMYDQRISNVDNLDCTLAVILSMNNYVDMLMINIETGLELARSRIQARKNGESRLDFLDNNKLESILDIQIANFILIRERMSYLAHIDINASSSIENNVNILLSKVMMRQDNDMDK